MRENEGGGESNQDILWAYMEIVKMKHPVQLIHSDKNVNKEANYKTP
jgi:hypothetical protein